MRFISVCSGIEAASVAWGGLGFEAAWFSEIEPFPCSVLAHHYPGTRNLGDMTDWRNWPDEPVDLCVGGTPCQSFSIAGLRGGIQDSRGGLMLQYLGIIGRYKPRWVLWENVPGVLSANGGRDFGSFIGGLAQLGYGWAYRVLDAQWFGVAQRRRRVFVVGYLGEWTYPAKVLFERESLRRDNPPGRRPGESVTGTLAARFGRNGKTANDTVNSGQLIPTIAKCLTADMMKNDAAVETMLPLIFKPSFYTRGKNGGPSQIAPTLCANAKKGDQEPLIGSLMVRRLTPRECERLQGFPDDYTLVTHRNKPAADGPRYKALGNSMAVPVMRWIGKRIQEVDATGRVA